jgi:ribosome-associated protein
LATKNLTDVVIDALEDIKARDIKLINVSMLTSVFDYIAIASADSTRQTKALAKNVMDKVKESGGWIYGIEGEQSGEWVLVDCGDVVVHIMQPVMREHYKLEELWGEGKLEYPKPVAPKRKPVVPKAKATVKTKLVAKTKSTKKVAAKPKVVPKGAPKAAPKAAPKVVPKVALKTTKATKPGSAKAGAKASTTGVIAKVGKEKIVVAKAKVAKRKVTAKVAPKVAKKVVAKVAKIPATAARKKVATTTIKKAVTKKPAVKKPAIRRRKVSE